MKKQNEQGNNKGQYGSLIGKPALFLFLLALMAKTSNVPRFPLDEDLEPTHTPEKVYGDRAYDSEPHREELRQRGIEPKLAKRNTAHGSGLGKFRWVVERTISWLHGFRKLRFVTEKTDEMKYAFFDLAMALICFRFLDTPEPHAVASYC